MADGPSANGHPGGDLNLAAALGAKQHFATQRFTIYVPNRDQDGEEIGNQRRWVLEALRLMTELNGGATSMPPVEGVWQADDGRLVWEHPVLVYSYVRYDVFVANLPRVREFLHRMGRETNQGEVAVEFERLFLLIREYDPPAPPDGVPT